MKTFLHPFWIFLGIALLGLLIFCVYAFFSKREGIEDIEPRGTATTTHTSDWPTEIGQDKG